MKKIIAVFLVVVIICFSSCSDAKTNQNSVNENTTISRTDNNANSKDSAKSTVINIIDNPITDMNNPAYCLGKKVSVAENYFNTTFIQDDEDWRYYGSDSVFVACDLNTELIVAMEIELYEYEEDYLGLKLNMSYDNVCSILRQKGYSIKNDENKANLYFAEQTDYYIGLCTFDNVDDALQQIVYYVNTNEISSWIAVPDIMNKVLATFSMLNETTDGIDQDGNPIVVETVYGNEDNSVKLYFDMYSTLTKIVVMDNPNYFVFGVKTGMSLNNARQALSYDFKSVGENVFKDNRGCVVKLLVEKNIVKGISLSFEY